MFYALAAALAAIAVIIFLYISGLWIIAEYTQEKERSELERMADPHGAEE